MQSKVSMIVPCYNKELYIGDMFDSMLDQLWDNIEIIIINDGSTDRTRDIIKRYESKFKRHGYEVVIKDQTNQGVAVALLNGLQIASGDYICTVDSDDYLDSGYVYVMADYLDKHPEINRVICDHSGSQWRNAQSRGVTKNYCKEADVFPYPMYESQLLFRVAPTCCTNMIRRSYWLHCGLSNYSTLCRTSQEPGFNAAINSRQEKTVYIPRVLYKYLYRENSSITSYKGSSERLWDHFNNYNAAVKESIQHFEISKKDKNKLVGCAIIGMCWHINAVRTRTEDPTATTRKNYELAVSVANKYFSNLIKAEVSQVEKVGFRIFHRTLSNRIIGYKSTNVEKLSYKRIIAYGHGRVGRSLLPVLIETELKPDVIWDKNATGRYSYDSIPIRKPDMNDLTNEDLVLILISDLKVAEEVYDLFDGDNRENILPYYDLLDYLGDFYFKKPN